MKQSVDIGNSSLLLRVFFLGMLLLSQSSFAGTIQLLNNCHQLFPFRDAQKLQLLYDKFSREAPETFRNSTVGRWIQTSNGDWVRYQIFGKSGPIHMHLEGFGGQIETSLNNQILFQHLKSGRVLIIELEGQGMREVHRRIELRKLFIEDTRFISFDRNVETLREVVGLIAHQERFALQEIETQSGHSFGGMSLSAVLAKPDFSSSPVVQFYATGVANFNHRLLDVLTNSKNLFSSLAMRMVPGMEALLIQTAISRFGGDKLFETFIDDPIQMEAAVGLTMGAETIDAVTHAKHYPKGTKIQIFSGEADRVVFAMLHWELAVASLRANLDTALVLVEDVDHYLPQNINFAQLQTIQRMKQAPGQFKGFYLLKSNGDLAPHNQPNQQAALLNRFRLSSLATWNAQRDHLYRVFGSIGQTPHYPKSWIPTLPPSP